MSYPTRTLPSHFRNPSVSGAGGAQQHGSSSGQSPVLLARINEKKAELAHLKELQALSAGLADQMQTLEAKLETLSDGAEAVAAVLSNWHNVLRAINLASVKLSKPAADASAEPTSAPLPQTLVRIPTEHADALVQRATSGGPSAAAD